jgi:cardiolipin synthase A/B
MSVKQEQLFLDSNQYFTKLIHDINHAKEQIDIEMYCFERDILGKQIAEALITASQRGVAIRILVDGVGTPFWRGHIVQRMEKAGIQTQIFHPLPWNLSQYQRTSSKKPWLKRLLHLVTKMNTRNHKKLILIDQSIVYLGSRNIDCCHLEKAQGGKNWHDASLRLFGIGFPELSVEFERLWGDVPWENRLQQYFKTIDFQDPIRLNNTHQKRRAYYKQILRKIGKARQRIYITNAYFMPNVFLLKKIKDAAQSGVDVRLLVPQTSDIPIMAWASNALYDALLQSGVKIFEYHSSMLHAKAIIVDDWHLVGSSNLNHRSLLHDLEIDAVLQDASNRATLLKQFHTNLDYSHQILLNKPGRSILKRTIGRIIIKLKWLL